MNAERCLEWLHKPYVDPLTSKIIQIDGTRYNEIERACAKYINFDLLEQTDIEEFKYPESTPLLSFLSIIYFLQHGSAQGGFCHPFKDLYSATTNSGDPFIDNFDFSFRWVEIDNDEWQLMPPQYNNTTGPTFKSSINNCNITSRFAGIFIVIISKVHVTANLLLYDVKDKEWERFVPFGASQDKYNQWALDRSLITYLNDQEMTVKNYYSPYKGCPLDKTHYHKITPAVRNIYCAVWNLWFLKLKLQFPDEWQEKLIDRSRKMLNKDTRRFNTFVTDYLKYLINTQNKIINSIPESIFQVMRVDPSNNGIDDFLANNILSLLT